ncbi:MAG: hypothetical protein WCA85_10220 [Paraburkholderia sp.]|uniref:hypothetical protein n=1 Tax=Paraburkholderia sp. TaxID=1926495 RepID=UPI003C3F08F0
MSKFLVVALLAAGVTSLSYGGDGSPWAGNENGDPRPGHILKVFDSKGKIVGVLTSAGSTEGVVLNVSGIFTFAAISRSATANLQFSASQYIWTDQGGLFTSTDCSGSTVIEATNAPAPAILRPSTVVRQGATATLYIAPDAPSANLTIQSAGLAGACTTYGVNSSVPPVYTTMAWSPVKTYSLTQNYSEPLTIHY